MSGDAARDTCDAKCDDLVELIIAELLLMPKETTNGD